MDNCILGVLVENMRREGFELQLSAPEVIYKTINGVKNEPIEYVLLDIPARILKAWSWKIWAAEKRK